MSRTPARHAKHAKPSRSAPARTSAAAQRPSPSAAAGPPRSGLATIERPRPSTAEFDAFRLPERPRGTEWPGTGERLRATGRPRVSERPRATEWLGSDEWPGRVERPRAPQPPRVAEVPRSAARPRPVEWAEPVDRLDDVEAPWDTETSRGDRGGHKRTALRSKPVRFVAAAVVGSALLVAGWPALTHLTAHGANPAAMNQADVLGVQAAGILRGSAEHAPHSARPSPPKIVGVGVASGAGHRKPAVALSSGYQNPLRALSGLVPERIDEGVDFAGSGPIYAIGDAVVTNAGENAGWPGGGWITYRLTDGPEKGLMVFLAEDVTAAVQVGERVNSSTVIANMFNGSDGIETGWAMQSGLSAESELSEAGGIGGGGPFPTRVGVSFDGLLRSLGVPAAPNASDAPFGILPAGYPAG